MTSPTALQAGDIVWVEFDDPPFGHEQSGRRPALVLSDDIYNAMSSFVLLCPITSRRRDWPFQVSLTAKNTRGAAIVDQIKSVDRRRVVSPPVDRADAGTLKAARQVLEAILGLDPPAGA